MKMKILILAMSFAVVGNVTAQTQTMESDELSKKVQAEQADQQQMATSTNRDPMKADMRTVNDMVERTAKDLNLNDMQKEEVSKVYETHINALINVGKEGTVETRSRINDETEARMKSILTRDQFDKWKVNMPEAYNLNDNDILNYN